jgi:hypothetical protein
MSIVIVSTNDRKTGEEIGEKIAHLLHYRVVEFGDVRAAAEKEYGIREGKLARAVDDSASLLRFPPGSRLTHIAYLQAALIGCLLDDEVVYTGPVGHLFVKGISHVLRVFIVVPHEEQVVNVMEAEGITRRKAEKIVKRREKNHRVWTKEVFKVEDPNPSSFDLMINLENIERKEAYELIVTSARSRKFQAMTYSRKQLKDAELACRLRAHLIDLDADIRVESKGGVVNVYAKALGKAKEKKRAIIRERISSMSGVMDLTVHMQEDLFKRIGRTMR